MPSSDMAAEYAALRRSTSSLRALLSSYQAAAEHTIEPSTSHDGVLDPFSIFSDAAKLLKAQTTKLSLLLLNKPFSPKEITFVLNALASSVLPALQSALQLTTAERYTKVIHEHAKTSLKILWRELGSLVSNIPQDDKMLNAYNGNATLSSTGLLWEQCDTLIQLGDKGSIYFIDSKIKECMALLEDAIEELEQWDPNNDSDTEDGEDANDDRDKAVATPTTSDEETIGDAMGDLTLNGQVILKRRVMKRLRLVKLLYPAVRKRRIATLPEIKSLAKQAYHCVENIDALVQVMKCFTEHADELAGFLYAEDNDAVEEEIRRLNTEVTVCLGIISMNWEGREDEFTNWISKWRTRWEELD